MVDVIAVLDGDGSSRVACRIVASSTSGVPTGDACPARPSPPAGLVFVSACRAPVPTAGSSAPDIEAQTRRAHRPARRASLAGRRLVAGPGRERARLLRRASDFEAMNDVYRQSFADKPPVTDDGRHAILPTARSSACRPSPCPRARRARCCIRPAGSKSPRPYSVHRPGRRPRVSVGAREPARRRTTQLVPGPMSVQTKTILDNAGVLLKTAGLTYAGRRGGARVPDRRLVLRRDERRVPPVLHRRIRRRARRPSPG